jgi:hypothetical protein
MRYTLLHLFFIFSSLTFAQNTFSVNYSYGQWKVPKEQFSELQKFVKQFDNLEIDSILFIGSSDSAGLFLSNFRMTEWRGRQLKKEFYSRVKNHPKYRILPCINKGMGEVRDIRSVDIVVFLSKSDAKKKAEEILIKTPCYKVAYEAILSCHVNVFSRGKKEYVEIEKFFPFSVEDDEVLYSGTIDESGKFVAKEVKWKKMRTGEQWWKGERWVAKIPEKDFDRFKLFTIEEGPCNACHENFQQNLQIEDNEPKTNPDYVLMENVQFAQPWLMKNRVKIRVPKEFIDEDLTYVSNRKAIEWKEKSNGKQPDYFFATVSQTNGQIDLIYRPYRVSKDENCQLEKPFQFTTPTLQCAPNKARSEVINYLEFGMHAQNNSRLPYLAIGVFAGTSRIELEFLAGAHWKSALYGSIRARYNIINAPFSAFLPKNFWQHSLTRNRFWFCRLYLGTEYKASIGRNSENYLEPNFHFGFSFAQNGNPTFQRFFIQYGKGVNFLLESPRRNYSLFQFGIQVHLGKKEYLTETGSL